MRINFSPILSRGLAPLLALAALACTFLAPLPSGH